LSLPETRYVLRAEGIGKSFRGLEVLKSASLWGEPGKVTTLLGRNGSGKTTLMKIAVGALRPDYGVVSVFGDVRENQSLPRLARAGLMYVPQEQLVSPGYRVRDHLRALATTFGAEGVDDAVSEMRIEDLLDQAVRSLSGGERMRVSLALALSRAPTVLVADEPLVGLSPHDQEALGHSLRTLASRGTAVITCGHDAQALLTISDVILWSVAGTTHHIGTPTEALAHSQFRREYLGPGFGAT
jgi:lipopolysaccharide export system ATP-binding protein